MQNGNAPKQFSSSSTYAYFYIIEHYFSYYYVMVYQGKPYSSGRIYHFLMLSRHTSSNWDSNLQLIAFSHEKTDPV
ncbi:hypothetical protein VCSRO39_1016 [Vibrio cholerae]|nr:hypothetical protein VCSRO39_1016 [Vibrio cholerae]